LELIGDDFVLLGFLPDDHWRGVKKLKLSKNENKIASRKKKLIRLELQSMV